MSDSVGLVAGIAILGICGFGLVNALSKGNTENTTPNLLGFTSDYSGLIPSSGTAGTAGGGSGGVASAVAPVNVPVSSPAVASAYAGSGVPTGQKASPSKDGVIDWIGAKYDDKTGVITDGYGETFNPVSSASGGVYNAHDISPEQVNLRIYQENKEYVDSHSTNGYALATPEIEKAYDTLGYKKASGAPYVSGYVAPSGSASASDSRKRFSSGGVVATVEKDNRLSSTEYGPLTKHDGVNIVIQTVDTFTGGQLSSFVRGLYGVKTEGYSSFNW